MEKKNVLVTKDDYKRYEECLKKALTMKSPENFELVMQLIADEKISVFFPLTSTSSSSKINEADFLDDDETEADTMNVSDYCRAKLMDDDLWKDEADDLQLRLLTAKNADAKKVFDQEKEIEKYPGESIADGNEVGSVAQEYYMGKYAKFANLDLYAPKIALEKTKQMISDKSVDVYFEPAFLYDNCITKCDVLIRDQIDRDAFHLVEVKASSGLERDKKDKSRYVVKNIHKEHLQDVAYQYFVLTNANINLKSVGVLYLNNTYLRHGDLDYEQIFFLNQTYTKGKEEYPLIEYCQKQLADIANKVKRLHDYLNINNLDLQALMITDSCYNDNKEHEDYHHNYGHCKHATSYVAPKNTVFNLYKGKEKKTELFYEYGFVNLTDIPEGFVFERLNSAGKVRDFNVYQQRQIDYCKHLAAEFDSKKLSRIDDELAKYRYPIYMYDFETMKRAIPLFDYSHAYQQIPFQYSVHILTDESFRYDQESTMLHYDHLGNGEGDPRLKLIEQMVHDLFVNGKGTYVAYYKSFECSRINEMIKFLEDIKQNEKLDTTTLSSYSEWQEKMAIIRDNTIDLMVFFKDFQIYRYGFNGSTSIKKTLPAFVPAFTYEHLKIKKGDMAAETFRRRAENNIPLSLWLKYFREPMLIYCNQDTRAMVAVFQAICHDYDLYRKGQLESEG